MKLVLPVWMAANFSTDITTVDTEERTKESEILRLVVLVIT